MGQFEYAVGLSPVRPEDIEQLAKDYLAKKRDRHKMIKYEHNTLVLDSSHTKEDQEAIDSFVAYQIQAERDRIHDILLDFSQDPILSIPKFQITKIIYDTEEIF